MKSPKSVNTLEEFGRIRLSKSFFMRDFLYSEISQIEGIPNIPDDPNLAVLVGTALCENVLEPIQAQLGRISIRSAYRSCAVNAKGAEKGYRCARNEANYAGHIWDKKDQNGQMGATACIIVNSFIPYYEETGHWQALAWWIHDHIPAYSHMQFYPKYAAFNISWHESPRKEIGSYIRGDGGKLLIQPKSPSFAGSHAAEYQAYLQTLEH